MTVDTLQTIGGWIAGIGWIALGVMFLACPWWAEHSDEVGEEYDERLERDPWTWQDTVVAYVLAVLLIIGGAGFIPGFDWT